MHKLAILFLIIISIFFRTNNLEGKMTFEWDQERDMREVESMVKSGHPALVGPIVRGEVGGFYLGPAYYYSVLPLYLVSGGNPLSLSLISVGVDVLVAVLLYLYLAPRVGKRIALIMGSVWAGSPLLISSSYTPWNVSFIHLWMIGFLWALELMNRTGRLRYRLLVLFLAALTTSIHVSLIPVAAVLLIVNYRYFYRLSVKAYAWCLAAVLTPVSTLLYYDLTHSFDNMRRLKRFLFGVGTNPTSVGDIVPLIGEKLSYTVARLFVGEPYTYLGVVVLVIAVYIVWKNWKVSAVIRWCGSTALTIVVALLMYRDTDFAEYYFLPVFVPICIILATGLTNLPYRVISVMLGSSMAFYCLLGFATRNKPISPYSLTVKREVVTAIKNLGYPVEVRTRLPRERDTGFTYLAKDIGLVSDTSAPRKAYIYESSNMELIAPEEARSIILDKPIKAFKVVVFSN